MKKKFRSAIAASGKKFRKKNISQRIQKIVISPIKEMSILAAKWQSKSRKKIISFGQGIPYWDTPDFIKRSLVKAITKEPDTAKYTLEPGIPELRDLIAKHLRVDKKIKNARGDKEVMVSTGCQEALACALLSVIDEGDEVLIIEPAFASHIEQVMQFGGLVKFVPLIEEKGWRLDLEKLNKAVTIKTKAIIFSNPSNPTGSVLNKDEIEAVAQLALQNDLIIISDETYDFLTYDETRHISIASLEKIRDRVILCGSFSKRYALTGYRVGYAFSHEGIIDHLLKAHDALTICSPAISQKAAIRALKGPRKSVARAVRRLTKNRELMTRELDQLGDFFTYQKPLGAYYILAKFKWSKMDSFELSLKILYEANVIVIPGAAFGPSGEGHIRFSFAGHPEDILEGFRRLRKWVFNLSLHNPSVTSE